MRRAATALIAVVAVAAALASTASSSAFLKVGIFDDGQVLYGTPEEVFPLMSSTNARVVRVNLWWSGPALSVVKRKPKQPANPSDPAYDWTTYDRTVRFAVANGMHRLREDGLEKVRDGTNSMPEMLRVRVNSGT